MKLGKRFEKWTCDMLVARGYLVQPATDTGFPPMQRFYDKKGRHFAQDLFGCFDGIALRPWGQEPNDDAWPGAIVFYQCTVSGNVGRKMKEIQERRWPDVISCNVIGDRGAVRGKKCRWLDWYRMEGRWKPKVWSQCRILMSNDGRILESMESLKGSKFKDVIVYRQMAHKEEAKHE